MVDWIVVVGGGAAGLMAAGRAGEVAAGRAAEVLASSGAGGQVLVIEKMGREGNKLRLTGGGRCNLTNVCPLREFIAHLEPNGAFMRNAFARFFVQDLVDFFHAHGVPTVTERGRRVYPASNNAYDVAQALYAYCREQGVQFHYDAPVDKLFVAGGKVRGVLAGGEIIEAQRVILATGGLSYPRTGSTGDGHRLAQEVGHTITPLRPGLVPLVTAEEFVPRLQGLSLRNVRATLMQKDRVLASEFGEMLFTHFGVSGPIILTLSSRLDDALSAGPLQLCIDLKPALDEATLDRRLQRDLAALGKSGYYTLLKGLLPRALIEVFGERSGIPRDQRLSRFTAQQRGRVLHLLKHFDLTVVGTRPIAEAIITLGGVACKEIVPQTMASRLVEGLYFAGEIIDVAGDTGGYNLQVAFTTGRIAGESCAHAE